LALVEPSGRADEKEISRYITSEAFNTAGSDQRCHDRNTYDQISSLFSYRLNIAPENILYHRSALRTLLRNIAFKGCPSVECPHPSDPFKAVLDINADDYQDYAFFRAGKIAYRNTGGELAFAPPVTRQDVFVKWLDQLKSLPTCHIDTQIVCLP
jgi:hypothetical protein